MTRDNDRSIDRYMHRTVDIKAERNRPALKLNFGNFNEQI